MRFLLDTQIWLWLQSTPARVPARIRTQLSDEHNTLFLSSASAWEIAIKHALGKLPLPEPPHEYVTSRMRRDFVDGLPITHAHALQVATLPHLHEDPFDRLLIAQAQLEKLVLVTADSKIVRYDVDTMPAT
ncbi:type II toxin-antitoxin system VapC family toxin [Actinomycetes bacterium KLBMP 9759]